MISRILKTNAKTLVKENIVKTDYILDGSESKIFLMRSISHKQHILLISLPNFKMK